MNSKGSTVNATDNPEVSTDAGVVRGIRVGDVDLFIEIPYGADTGDANRFKPPQPVQPWEGVRDATQWTTRTMQYPDSGLVRTPRQWFSMQGPNYAPGLSEDCLLLNIWTPNSSDDVRRPVIVWIHGGGYSVGHAASTMSDGANFATEHDAVFVSVTHRLNAFGFLFLESLGGEDYRGSGNAGLLDIVAALKWIQANITQFGGDPNSVTLVGESGGGGKVSTLLASSIEDGLFHRAVCESGVALRAVRPEDSETYARALIRQLGGEGIETLLQATAQEILDAQLEIERVGGVPRLGPVIDGQLLTAEPLQIWAAGGGKSIPVIAGTMHDEVTVFGNEDLPLDVEMPAGHPGADIGGGTPAFDVDGGQQAIAGLAGRDVDQLYQIARDIHPGVEDKWVTTWLIGDVLFRYPTEKFAELRALSGKPTWVYQLDWASPRIAPRGAPHSSSVSLFFNNVEKLYFSAGLPEAARVSRAMSSALATFMREGVPRPEIAPEWPPYGVDRREVMVFDDPSYMGSDLDAPIREELDRIEPKQLL